MANGYDFRNPHPTTRHGRPLTYGQVGYTGPSLPGSIINPTASPWLPSSYFLNPLPDPEGYDTMAGARLSNMGRRMAGNLSEFPSDFMKQIGRRPIQALSDAGKVALFGLTGYDWSDPEGGFGNWGRWRFEGKTPEEKKKLREWLKNRPEFSQFSDMRYAEWLKSEQRARQQEQRELRRRKAAAAKSRGHGPWHYGEEAFRSLLYPVPEGMPVIRRGYGGDQPVRLRYDPRYLSGELGPNSKGDDAVAYKENVKLHREAIIERLGPDYRVKKTRRPGEDPDLRQQEYYDDPTQATLEELKAADREARRHRTKQNLEEMPAPDPKDWPSADRDLGPGHKEWERRRSTEDIVNAYLFDQQLAAADTSPETPEVSPTVALGDEPTLPEQEAVDVGDLSEGPDPEAIIDEWYHLKPAQRIARREKDDRILASDASDEVKDYIIDARKILRLEAENRRLQAHEDRMALAGDTESAEFKRWYRASRREDRESQVQSLDINMSQSDRAEARLYINSIPVGDEGEAEQTGSMLRYREGKDKVPLDVPPASLGYGTWSDHTGRLERWNRRTKRWDFVRYYKRNV